MRNRLKKIVKNLKIKVKKRVNHVFLHKYKYAFFYKREKIHVKKFVIPCRNKIQYCHFADKSRNIRDFFIN